MTDARLAAIIQARMSSARAPGKMLRTVAGKPVLEYVVERLRHCPSIGEVVVATSDDPSDDAIDRFCRMRGLSCVRGPLDDVAARFLRVIEARGYPAFARVCGDRAMLDTTLIDRARALLAPNVDLVTNANPRTFPAGQTVELVRSAALTSAYPKMNDPADKEHVTRYFYRTPAEFRIASFTSDFAAPDVHLAIDREEDIRRFEAMVRQMTRPHWTYHLQELVSLYHRVNGHD